MASDPSNKSLRLAFDNRRQHFRASALLWQTLRKRWRLILRRPRDPSACGRSRILRGDLFSRRRAPKPATLQTTVARRGDITLSASGTGTLQAAQQADLAFKATGKLTTLNVKVGDHVSQGQLLAELENTAQQLKYEQAKQNLDSLTSISAIGNAQKALATATQQLKSAELQLEYLISPDVYYWETEIAKDEQAVKKPRPRPTRRRRTLLPRTS